MKPEDRPCRNAVSRSIGKAQHGYKVCEVCYRRSRRLQRFKKNDRRVAGYTYVLTDMQTKEHAVEKLERPELQIMQETRAAGLYYDMPDDGPPKRRVGIKVEEGDYC
jgi:hypothetical protein